jgi:uncharacterized membrane protein (DUF373 family)
LRANPLRCKVAASWQADVFDGNSHQQGPNVHRPHLGRDADRGDGPFLPCTWAHRSRRNLGAPEALIPVQGLLEIFVFVPLVLIGVELLETLKAYVKKDAIHIRVVLQVAQIAMARKVILEEPNAVASLTLYGIAARILALGMAFFFERQAKPETGHGFLDAGQPVQASTQKHTAHRLATEHAARLYGPREGARPKEVA